MSKNRVQYIEDEDLRSLATRFLSSYNQNNVIPVDIEGIVEMKLKLKICPIPGFRNNFGVESHIAINLNSIIVDDYSYHYEENRFRFTLAHEVGHYLLHRGFFDFESIDSIDSYLRYKDSINLSEEKRLEYQARYVAGYILMPRKEFRQQTAELIKLHGGSNALTEFDLEEIVGTLANNFQVSPEVAGRQFMREFKDIYDKILEAV